MAYDEERWQLGSSAGSKAQMGMYGETALLEAKYRVSKAVAGWKKAGGRRWEIRWHVRKAMQRRKEASKA